MNTVNVQTRRTGRFLDSYPYIALAATVLVVLAMMGSVFFSTTLVNTTVTVNEGEPVELLAVPLKKLWLGALRIDANANIPANQWLIYEIQIRDQQGVVIAAAMKQAWHETGTWSEEGESGSWQESDLKAGLDLRTTKPEPIQIAIDVLEYTDTSGQTIEQPVPIQVKVINGVIDHRYLWLGLGGSSILTLLSLWAVGSTGTKVINKRLLDSDVGDRATCGGNERLVQVTIQVRADERSPVTVTAHLHISDVQREPLYAATLPIRMSYQKDDNDKIQGASGAVSTYFLFPKRGSYGFYVEVMPDAPIDWTRLTVLDGAKTLGTVELTQVQMA